MFAARYACRRRAAARAYMMRSAAFVIMSCRRLLPHEAVAEIATRHAISPCHARERRARLRTVSTPISDTATVTGIYAIHIETSDAIASDIHQTRVTVCFRRWLPLLPSAFFARCTRFASAHTPTAPMPQALPPISDAMPPR